MAGFQNLTIFTPKQRSMQKVVLDFTVVSNLALNESNHLLRMRAEEPLLAVAPGQFVNVEIPGSSEVFLRRPFSVFDADPERGELSLLVKVLGRGSRTLCGVQPGQKVSVVYPLGRGYTLPGSEERVLAVGGGSGVAPLLFLARRAGLPPGRMQVILGARSAGDHIPTEAYSRYATLSCTTEDGSLGTRGMVTDHPLFDRLEEFSRVYTCGPLPMMKAVAARATAAGRFCEVSLENLMACGFGVCLCCIEPTVHGNLCVCTEGPVFNINDLKW